MSLVQIWFGASQDASGVGPFVNSFTTVYDAITPASTNKVSTVACPANCSFVDILSDTAVTVAIGAAPNALTAANAKGGAFGIGVNVKERIRCNGGDKVGVVLSSAVTPE
jgi:hypothetical protein